MWKVTAVLILAAAIHAVPVQYQGGQNDDSLVASAQTRSAARAYFEEDDLGDRAQPSPYMFSIHSDDTDGTHTHEEQADGNGRVTGSYAITLADGRSRVVRYYADETGFHPEVETNEQGTESGSPAGATYSSSALSGPEAARAAEPERLKAVGTKSEYVSPTSAHASSAGLQGVYLSAGSPASSTGQNFYVVTPHLHSQA